MDDAEDLEEWLEAAEYLIEATHYEETQADAGPTAENAPCRRRWTRKDARILQQEVEEVVSRWESSSKFGKSLAHDVGYVLPLNNDDDDDHSWANDSIDLTRKQRAKSNFKGCSKLQNEEGSFKTLT